MTRIPFLQSGSMVALLLGSTVAAQAAQSIVGTWSPDPGACTPVAGMVDIEPLALTADGMRCTFRDVARRGEVVTWHGACSDGATRTPTTVVAALRHGTLSIRLNEAPAQAYRRCTPE